MIYKTLIIFDTNSVRHIDYVNFEIGGDYKDVNEFIKNNNLGDLIHVALPEFVVDEIKKQKIEQFEKDYNEHKRISDKFEKLGIQSRGSNGNFDVKKHLDDQSDCYLRDNNLKVIKLPRTEYDATLEKIIKRAIAKKLPFKKNKDHSDIGFKDVLIWETILSNQSLILGYDNIFYCSGDNGFNECKKEFEKDINRNFEHFKEGSFLIEKLEEQYFELIRNKRIYDFAKTDYFLELVGEKIEELGVLSDFSGEEKEIETWEMIDPCVEIEKVEFSDQESECFRITSHVHLYINGESQDNNVITTINDANEVVEFDIE